MPVIRNTRLHHVLRASARRWFGVLLTVVAATVKLGAYEIADARKEFLKGDYASAVIAAAVGVKETPGDEEWHLLHVDALLALGRADEADRALADGLGRVPQSLRLHWIGREVAFANGRPERATKLLESLRELYANRPSAYRTAPDLVVFGRAALLLGADPKDVLTRVYALAQKAAHYKEPEARNRKVGLPQLGKRNKLAEAEV
jgi:predicted Zn-dependent protease